MCLKNKLENLGAKIILTRDTDTTIELLERESFVKKQSPDLSISIHHNSSNPTPNNVKEELKAALGEKTTDKSLVKVINRTVDKIKMKIKKQKY